MKRLIFVCMMLVFAFALVACGYGGTATTSSWSNSGLSQDSQLDSWSITADRVNGHSLRRLDLTAYQLANIFVASNHTSGAVNVVLIQGDNEQSFSIANDFSGILDTSNFEPGNIRMRLNFANAQDVDIYVSWAR